VKKTFVENIRERDWVDSPFLVRDKILAMAKNGKPYMTVKLIDRSGEVEGRIWDRVDEFDSQFGKDDFIHVQGKASVYLGKMQLIIQELRPLPEAEIDLADFLPVSRRSSEDMRAEFGQLIDSLSDPFLSRLMQGFFNDTEFMAAFLRAPAAKTMHHVYLGGLLEHSLAVAHLVEDVCRRYARLNRDLLLVGALLHDIGKVAELRYARSFDYTDEGKLVGHIVIGVEMVEDRIRAIDGFPRPLAVLVKHLLLSHHGQYEYGSPKRPKTLEAVVLNFLDDLDSKINGVQAHIEKEQVGGGNWTSYHRLYDRYFFVDEYNDEPLPAAGPEPETVPAPRPQPAPPRETAPRQERQEKRPEPRGKFGFTLADQLKGKSLDLFGEDKKDKES